MGNKNSFKIWNILGGCTGCVATLNPGEPKAALTVGWLSKIWSLLGTLNIRGRIIIGIQKGTIILTTSQFNLTLDLVRV